jgi:hypothetical protein
VSSRLFFLFDNAGLFLDLTRVQFDKQSLQKTHQAKILELGSE